MRSPAKSTGRHVCKASQRVEAKAQARGHAQRTLVRERAPERSNAGIDVLRRLAAIGIGAAGKSPAEPLPHHRTSGSASGGSEN